MRAISLLFLIILISSCTNLPMPNTAEQARISFAVPGYEWQVYNAVAQQFEQQHPDISVQVVQIDNLLGTSTTNSIPGAAARALLEQVDAAIIPVIAPEDVTQGTLKDLTPFVERDAPFDKKDYYPSAISGNTFDNKLYGLPRTIYTPLLRYNRQQLVLEKSNLSWTDIVTTIEQSIQASGNTQIYGIDDHHNGQRVLLGLLVDQLGSVVHQPLRTLELDAAQIQRVFKQYALFVQHHGVYIAKQEESHSQDDQPQQLQALVEWEDSTDWSTAALAADSNIGLLPTPFLPQPMGSGTTDSYVISNGTQYAEHTWQWIAFLSKQPLESLFTSPYQLPARVSLNEQRTVWKTQPALLTSAFTAALQQVPIDTNQRSFSARFIQFVANANVAIQQGQDPEQVANTLLIALQQAQQELATTPTTIVPAAFSVPTPVSLTPPAGAVTIRLGGIAQQDQMLYRSLLSQYQEQHPDQYVLLQSLNESQITNPFEALANNSDCFLWFGQPPTDQLTATLDLKPLLDADRTIPTEDYPPAVLEPFRKEPGLYGVPLTIQFPTIGYNPRLFDQAGMSYPTADWTMQDFLNAAVALQQPANKQYGYAESTVQTMYARFIVALFGGQIWRSDAAGVHPNYTDPKVAEAIAYYVQLLQNASPHTTLSGYAGTLRNDPEQDLFTLIRQGRVAMWLNIGVTSIDIGESDTMAVAPLPLKGSQIAIAPTDSVSFHISRNILDPRPCWDMLRLLSTNPTLLPSAYTDGQPTWPARRSIVAIQSSQPGRLLGISETYDAYVGQQHIAFQPHAIDALNTFWLWRAIDKALQGADLKTMLAEAQQVTEENQACVASGEAPVACYQMTVSQFPDEP